MKKLSAVLVSACLFWALPVWPAERPETRPALGSLEGVWKLERIVRSTGSIDTQGGFVFLSGYYSTIVNYSQLGT